MAVASLHAVAGCSNQTAIILQVDGPASPAQAGVTQLAFVTSHPTWCDRWVEVAKVTVDVGGRNLAKSPYELLVQPAHFTDLSEDVDLTALALDSSGAVVGSAYFGTHKFRLHTVDKYRAQLLSLARQGSDRPVYTSSDGCVCLPGQPWRGNGSGTGCDLDVVTSFDRLVDTATCELGPGKRELMGPVCDGQHYGDTEPRDRSLPCFATQGAGCNVTARNCHDDNGQAYDDECTPDTNTPALPSGALCAAYLACEQEPCGDLIGCFLDKVPPEIWTCQLRVDATTAAGTPVKPCTDGKWEASLDPAAPALTGAACVASVIEGVAQPPFTIGLQETGQMGAQAIATQCPPTLVVDGIDAMSPDDLPAGKILNVTVGDRVLQLHIAVVRGCATAPSLQCKKGT